MSTVATWEGETFRLDALGACLKPGRLIELQEVHFTRDESVSVVLPLLASKTVAGYFGLRELRRYLDELAES